MGRSGAGHVQGACVPAVHLEISEARSTVGSDPPNWWKVRRLNPLATARLRTAWSPHELPATMRRSLGGGSDRMYLSRS